MNKNRVLFFDCFSGISGDMILGALVDLGVNLDSIRKGLEGLNVKGYAIKSRKVKRNGITGTKIDIVFSITGCFVSVTSNSLLCCVVFLLLYKLRSSLLKKGKLVSNLGWFIPYRQIHPCPVWSLFIEGNFFFSKILIFLAKLFSYQLCYRQNKSYPTNFSLSNIFLPRNKISHQL